MIVFGVSTANIGNNKFVQTLLRGNYTPYGRVFLLVGSLSDASPTAASPQASFPRRRPPCRCTSTLAMASTG